MGYCDRLPRSVQLAIACGGIFFSFSYFAVLQEDVYKKPYGGEYFKYTFIALVAERGVNALIGFIGVCMLGSSGLTIPHRDIFVSGISQMLAMAGSNEALRYVSYPTQVLGKSCKMVPVMAGGIVLGGKRRAREGGRVGGARRLARAWRAAEEALEEADGRCAAAAGRGRHGRGRALLRFGRVSALDGGRLLVVLLGRGDLSGGGAAQDRPRGDELVEARG